MKNFLKTVLAVMTILAVAGCGGSSAQQPAGQSNAPAAEQKDTKNAKKILVLYFSRSGNTREIAQQIHQKVGGDIAEIKTVTPYPQNYNDTTKQAKEELESGFKPKLQAIGVDIAQYDAIFIGSPIWWSTVATPVISFLSQNDMAGKTLIPFVTHGGSGVARSVSNIKELCPKATVKDVLVIRGSDAKNAQAEVQQWLQKLGMP